MALRRDMHSLNLGARPQSSLPASAFPNRADIYVCDACGRDVTKHFRARQSHSWSPMGCDRYRCACGQVYLTGAKEWDQLGAGERMRRVGQSVWLGILFSAMFSLIGLIAYLVLHLGFGLREGARITALVITGLPFALIQIVFWPSVLASMWRTRVGARAASGG